MTAQNAPGTVDLFGDNDAREQMRERHGGQGQDMIGPSAGLVVESGEAADEQGDIATRLTPLGQQFRHVFAADAPAATVEYHGDLAGADLGEQPFLVGLTAAGRYDGQVQGTVGGQPLCVLCEAFFDPSGCLADGEQSQFHADRPG